MMSASNRVIVAMLGVAALAVAFWMLLLSPKKDEVSKLDNQVAQQEELLSLHRSEVQRGLEAQKAFPVEYQQLVVLGKAAPADDDTASLLVQLNGIALDSKVRFQTFVLNPAGGETEAPEAQPAPAPGETVSYPSPTEVSASTMPLGAAIGPAGLAVMPYTLTFKGSFFHVADFIHGLDTLVKTKNEEVEVTGRLITINGFTLTEDSGKGFPYLEASFTVTTFLVPPEQGVTGGASPSSPEPSTTPVATTTGGTP
jgi:type II secretory pathway pseudopilin PulG